MDAKIWADMFALGLPVIEKIIRPIIIYFFLVVGLRLAGKRELAQLNPFDLVVLLTISNTVQNAIIGDDNSITGGLIGGATLLLVNYLVVRYLYDHTKLDRFVEGDRDILIQNGQVRLENLRREVITRAELEIAAHRQGFGSLDEIESAEIEPGGAVTFVGKKPTPETERFQEIISRLDQISDEMKLLRTSLGR